MKHAGFLAIILSCSMLLCSCGVMPISSDLTEKEKKEISLGLTPDFSYQVPESVPSIATDQVGYLPDSDKTAIFLGTHVPSSFEIISTQTGEKVYEGTIHKKGQDPHNQMTISYGSFSDFQTEGTYIIKCDVIGESYPFTITQDTYTDLMEELSKQLDDADEEMTGNDSKVLGSGLSEKMTDRGTVMTGAETAGVLMLAYELYPEYFNQFLEGTAGGLRVPAVLETVRSETDWMLTMQDPVSGGVYAGMVKASDQVADTTPETQAETEGSTEVYTAKDVSFRATACYAATLARFSFLYKSYDSTYANKCQKAAEQAWSNLQKTQSGDELDEGAEYYAATELFRLTGLKKYHDVIQDRVLYLSENKNLNEFTFLGDVTYLSTQGKVNKDICNQLISILMKDSESIAENASESLYFVDKDGNGTNSQNILWNMLKMSVVDYVITNHEYSTVIENHVHYLLGANANVTCYMNEFGSRNEGEETDLENQIISLPEKAELMLLLCAVTSQHEMVISS